ncbi:predicted protein [Plenodomus lingam JN3]|uniref:Predicted protein n=1 Tax=Leptosphaeria maculans (strain JN3 / isolate v23.1.3 / race Av1-4-5-6-7-8) TaxID=985895 RepID=E5R545_LEPMJ|nr:predicted protein [Plenodomus lingam JN3]CBX92015.1 predicted protein [Plenodomus lingam JN3]
MGNETTLVICFGIITIIATVAGLHYRDSLCCLMCRSLVGAWSTTAVIAVKMRMDRA